MDKEKLLIVVDMQKDFVDGTLGTKEAVAIVPPAVEKVKKEKEKGTSIWFTRDTHGEDYLQTQEGEKLPVPHCIQGTAGWEIIEELASYAETVIDKPSFGSLELARRVSEAGYREVELIGLCTDICVVSNALLIKAAAPEVRVSVDADCCAGVSPATHEAALLTMETCQVEVKRGESEA